MQLPDGNDSRATSLTTPCLSATFELNRVRWGNVEFRTQGGVEMILGFLAQRLIWHAVVFTEFSLMLNEAALKIWFPWLSNGEKSDWVFVDGQQELGYQLVPAGVAQQDSELYPALTLAEYRNLLQMRNWGLEPEGEDTVTSDPVLSWMN